MIVYIGFYMKLYCLHNYIVNSFSSYYICNI